MTAYTSKADPRAYYFRSLHKLYAAGELSAAEEAHMIADFEAETAETKASAKVEEEQAYSPKAVGLSNIGPVRQWICAMPKF